MKPDDVANKVFSAAYVDSYEARFQGGDWFKNTYLYDVELYAAALKPGSRWIDLGCGTGWHLSHFPDVDRVGLDISPSMIATAAAANPGAEFVEGSFLDPHPEWAGKFDLITMSGWAYSYLDTLDDIELMIENIHNWCSPDGTVILWVGDGEELVYGTWMPWYDDQNPRWWGQNVLAVIYDWEDVQGGVRHERMIAPQARMFARLFGRYFSDIHIERYPMNHDLWMRQKSIVATRRRAERIDVRGDFPVLERYPPDGHPLEQPSGGAPADVEVADPEPEPEVIQLPEPEVEHQGPELTEQAIPLPDYTRRQHLWLGMPGTVRSIASTVFRALPRGIRQRISARVWR